MTTTEKGRTIAPATGKLGVLLPGMGAVATTFIAGVEAIRTGLSRPVGSLTQMCTVRLGKRTDGRNPRISEFVPLTPIEDVVLNCWGTAESPPPMAPPLPNGPAVLPVMTMPSSASLSLRT